jgi:hypothetical protein
MPARPDRAPMALESDRGGTAWAGSALITGWRRERGRGPRRWLVPAPPEERSGKVANVVFPTGIDRRDDLGPPDRFDVYYGMADDRTGVARLEVPEHLPPAGAPSSPKVTRTGATSP